MKKIFFYALLIISINFVLYSCNKEPLDYTQNNQTESEKPQQPKTLYRLLSCAYENNGVYYSGFECVAGTYEQCLDHADCQPIVYNGGWLPLPQSFPSNWGFTQEEEENWDLGEDIIENSDEFIESHYNFFLFMYESGFSLHPDTLMLYNE